mmetsp:Transcript_4918/g.12261  ORF Transcript_4918/g.12261 Transcript_4918/m.12261 type:complete len:257 (-) Transcript_4918:1806-2576(-)
MPARGRGQKRRQREGKGRHVRLPSRGANAAGGGGGASREDDEEGAEEWSLLACKTAAVCAEIGDQREDSGCGRKSHGAFVFAFVAAARLRPFAVQLAHTRRAGAEADERRQVAAAPERVGRALAPAAEGGRPRAGVARPRTGDRPGTKSTCARERKELIAALRLPRAHAGAAGLHAVSRRYPASVVRVQPDGHLADRDFRHQGARAAAEKGGRRAREGGGGKEGETQPAVRLARPPRRNPRGLRRGGREHGRGHHQ